MSQEIIDICYTLVFVYNSTEPEKKLEFPTTLPIDYNEVKNISDFSVNKIVINEIPENYQDLWMSSKFQYISWARDKLIKMTKEMMK